MRTFHRQDSGVVLLKESKTPLQPKRRSPRKSLSVQGQQPQKTPKVSPASTAQTPIPMQRRGVRARPGCVQEPPSKKAKSSIGRHQPAVPTKDRVVLPDKHRAALKLEVASPTTHRKSPKTTKRAQPTPPPALPRASLAPVSQRQEARATILPTSASPQLSTGFVAEANSLQANRLFPSYLVLQRRDVDCLKEKAVWYGDDDDCVLMQPTTGIHHRKLSAALHLMDTELGHAMDTEKDKESMTFFYVDGHRRVLGVAVVERIDTAYLLQDDPKGKASPAEGLRDGARCDGAQGIKSQTEGESDRPLCNVDLELDWKARRTPESHLQSQPKAASPGARAGGPGMGTERDMRRDCRERARIWAEKAHSCKSAEERFEWCMCGISRIWVHQTARRQGIASRLLEVARENLVYGFMIPRQQVAFSQPTIDGKLFALDYTGTMQLMVYY